ncbi:hypothetical protein [Thiothrix subterranea]|uniref:Uncharacterized protein n=1 Tax=Thiothrix subterranea TaxID=2735563 RepID=A0AA51QYJ2_9GAMM|nr:hypothetical protein [Thiothrix subterranea]MDQ5769943.1 hypothetical protein [Thiothrix subterranea]WML86032.1 hypothetical protein RCG00_17245 [Thiothrix subterranea]
MIEQLPKPIELANWLEESGHIGKSIEQSFSMKHIEFFLNPPFSTTHSKIRIGTVSLDSGYCSTNGQGEGRTMLRTIVALAFGSTYHQKDCEVALNIILHRALIDSLQGGEK